MKALAEIEKAEKDAAKTIDKIMEEIQIFASAWSLIGGIFDNGNALQNAEDQKAELRKMIGAALSQAKPASEWISVNDQLPKIGQALKFMVPVKGYFTNAGTGARFVRENGKTHFVFSGAEIDILWKPQPQGKINE